MFINLHRHSALINERQQTVHVLHKYDDYIHVYNNSILHDVHPNLAAETIIKYTVVTCTCMVHYTKICERSSF